MLNNVASLAALLFLVGTSTADDKTKIASEPPKIILNERHGHVTPRREGFTHTGAGTTDIAQPSPDTLIVTMYGVAVAGGHPVKDSMAAMDFDLNQCFEIVSGKPSGQKIKLTVEARVIGLLRSHEKGGGSAEESGGCTTITCGPDEVMTLTAPKHIVSCGENLSINDREGPASAHVSAGKYILHQSFHLQATHPRSFLPCKATSVEFAPDPALDPLWISAWEPFHGASKKDFGLQVTIKVAAE